MGSKSYWYDSRLVLSSTCENFAKFHECWGNINGTEKVDFFHLIQKEQWDFERNDISCFTFSLKVVIVSIFILSKTSELIEKLTSKVQNAVPLRNPQMSWNTTLFSQEVSKTHLESCQSLPELNEWHIQSTFAIYSWNLCY